MKNDSFDLMLKQTSANFSKNLKNLLIREGMSQKILGIELDVAASTISAYMNGSKLPTCEFLIRLKKRFPEVSIDDLLTGDLPLSSAPEKPEQILSPETDLNKYFGTYYSYYLDTSKKNQNRFGEITLSESVIKKGILYVYKDLFSENNSEALCLAVFGPRNGNTDEIKTDIETLNVPADAEIYLRKHYPHNLYKGTMKFSHSHIFINLHQDIDKKDMAAIILHRVETSKSKYLGGLGTINSASTGRPSDPVVQLIGFSRYKIRLSDEEIKAQLRFSPPTVNITMKQETNDILNLAENMYKKDPLIEDGDEHSMDRFIPTIIESKLKYLLDRSIADNLLWYGKVSASADNEWYHLLKASIDPQTLAKEEDNA